jgi:hypothetical protein
VVRVSDYGDRLRFKVFGGNNESIVGMPEVLVRTINSPDHFDQLIQEIKKKIMAKGYIIDPP